MNATHPRRSWLVWLILLLALLLTIFWAAHRPESRLHDSRGAWLPAIATQLPGWTWQLESQAFDFIGPLTGTPYIALVDWQDAHGALVTAIVQRALPKASVQLFDIYGHYKRLNCERLTEFGLTLALVSCAQRAVHDALAEAGESKPQVISLSLGFLSSGFARYLGERDCSRFPHGLWFYEVAELVARLQAEGVQVVASAGNSGASGILGFPACLRGVWPAAALERAERYEPEKLRVANYSNIAERIFILPIGGLLYDPWGENYAGTSFAAPMLAAIVGALVTKCPTATTLRTRLQVREKVWERVYKLYVPRAEDVEEALC